MEWSAADIKRLCYLIDVEKAKWKAVAKELNRSYHACYHKYQKVKKANGA